MNYDIYKSNIGEKKMFFGKKFSGYRSDILSGLDILVLSIIKNNNGISGYDIIQKINKKFKDLWKASAGTIYPLLNRLTVKGFVEIEEIMESNRQKKIYRINDDGKKALKEILETNLEPSMNTLGDYIKTVVKASIPSEKLFDKVFSCFPFCGYSIDEKVNESDYSLTNIEHIERIIKSLEHSKLRFLNNLKEIDKNIERHMSILKRIREERNKNSRIIEIIDDNEEFEDF